MFQPNLHTYHDDKAGDGTVNYYGTLRLQVQRAKITTSKPAIIHDITFAEGVTVGDIVQFIYDRKLQFYKFHPDGSGCLFWQLTLMDEFSKVGWIPENSTQAIREAIVAFRGENPERLSMVLYPPVQGSFYTPISVRTDLW